MYGFLTLPLKAVLGSIILLHVGLIGPIKTPTLCDRVPSCRDEGRVGPICLTHMAVFGAGAMLGLVCPK
jgi:hypothetical protein